VLGGADPAGFALELGEDQARWADQDEIGPAFGVAWEMHGLMATRTAARGVGGGIVPDSPAVKLGQHDDLALESSLGDRREATNGGLPSHARVSAGSCWAPPWQDVNWDDGTLTIERSLTDVGAVEGPTKQRRSRTIVLVTPVLDALRELHDRSPRLTPWIFANGDDGLPWSRRSMWREFTRVRKAAKLPEIRLYDLRHTAATSALRRGVPLTEVSYMLGHAKVSITVDYYARWLPSGQRDAARIIAESLPPALHPRTSSGTSAVRSAVNGPLTR
jgi:hypothetical protein